MKKAVVFGAGGFIGSHLVKCLKAEGYWVHGVDLKYPEFSPTVADKFTIADLREKENVETALKDNIDELYQLAADMGGAGYIFTGDNDAHVMHNSALINLHSVQACVDYKVEKVFYSSSACMYPEYNQLDPNNPKLAENTAYPAQPDSEYGWEKLFSERLYLTFQRNLGLNCKIARFHNIYGPEGAWNNGKEKAPAAICRKVAQAKEGESIEIWGDGVQTRSFLYIDDCVDAVRLLMQSEESGPFNIGSEEMISINDFAKLIISISGKDVKIKNIDGPTGVRGRCSDNALVSQKLLWTPNIDLKTGIEKLYQWIELVHENSKHS
ncbi:MAG: NAD-dependent epimerase/dehydratase family protein [Flavobacteriales bacterium]|nr:NAD-dependent epimerase/dehydratase family protein [Flavobacteriales bacterium]